MLPSRTQSVVSITVGGVLVWYACRQIDVAMTWGVIRGAGGWPLLAGFVLMVAAYVARGARWLIWNDSLTFSNALKAVLVGFMGNNILPARLGEVLRADWMAVRSGDGHGRASALSSIAAERIIDGAVLSAFAIVGLGLSRIEGTFLHGLLFVSGLFALLALALAFAVMKDATIRRVLDRLNAVFPGHLTAFAKTKANDALDGVGRLRNPTRLTAAILATAGIWLLELGVYWVLGRAIAPIDLPTGIMLIAVANFASLFPLTVGGIGAIESVATAFLVSVGVPPHQALALILVQHAFQLLFTTTTGAAIYFTGRRPAAAKASPVREQDVLRRTREHLEALTSTVRLEPPDGRAVSLSIVIPAYNEHDRLPRTALETIRWCNQNASEYEIVLVDDGSTDDTLAVAALIEDHDRYVRKLACPNKGKGAAVRMGMLNARGKYILFMDADGATPLTEIAKLTAQLDKGNDVAIGSRVLQAPGEAWVETSLHRRIIGRAFAFFVKVFAVSGIADTQCGFKMFRREVAKAIFSNQKLDGFAFDVEILFIARQLGLSISEVPVNWVHQAGSKVNLVTDSIKMLWDLTHIRWLHKRTVFVASKVLAQPVGRA